MINKAVVDNAYGFAGYMLEICNELKKKGYEDLGSMLFKSSCNIGSNLYKATFFKQPGEIYNFVNASIQSACEVDFYLKLIAEKELLDASVILTATNKCSYLRKVAERAQLIR